MKKIIMIMFMLPLLAFAQEQGIQFEHNTNWEQVKAKAKAENKHIFVDCFATWCGPCKWMASEVFPQPQVGEFFNANFVNLKLQFDQTKEDSDDVKSWYDEAKRFEKEYTVNAYPTFLIFNPDGELVDKVIGGNEADPFIERVKKSLNPETQYYTIKKKYEANPNNKKLAEKILAMAIENTDDGFANEVFENINKSATDEELLQVPNYDIIVSLAQSSVESKAFQLLYNNKSKFESYFSEKYNGAKVDDLLTYVVYRSEIAPHVSDPSSNVDEVFQRVSAKYKDLDFTRMQSSIKMGHYLDKKEWGKFVESYNKVIEENPNISPSNLNQYAWKFFEECEDKEALKAALGWSKLSLDKAPDKAEFLDTYANLLYKLGDKNNAITWQEKAVSNADESLKEELSANLEKMKKGEQTW